jgi:CRP/FNR family transcriptional regulator
MQHSDWTQSFPGLKRVPDDVQARLIGATKIVELPQGSRIFAPGHAPESFLLLLDGVEAGPLLDLFCLSQLVV